MSHRDSSDDLGTFTPDVAAMQREFDPAYGEKKLRDALAKGESEGASAEVNSSSVKEAKVERQESPRPYEVPLSTPGPAHSLKAAPRRAPVRVKGRARWTLPKWLVYTMALVAPLGPAAIVMVLMRRPPPVDEAASPRAAESGAERASGPASDLEAPSASASAMQAVKEASADAGADAQGALPTVVSEPSTAVSEKKPEPLRTPVRAPKKDMKPPEKASPAPEPPPKTAPPKGEDDDVMR